METNVLISLPLMQCSVFFLSSVFCIIVSTAIPLMYNPQTEVVGTVWKIQKEKKQESSDFTFTVCQQIYEKIIQMFFKKNAPHRTIGRDLDISTSTVHNIVKRLK